jgi:hypothetical protein
MEERKMARGESLPMDWQPTNGDRDYGHALRLSDAQIDSMAEEMRLWAGANSNRQVARKSNWSMAFKGWMLRESKKSTGVYNGHRGSRSLQDDSRSVSKAIDRLAEAAERGQLSFAARPSLLPLEGPSDLRLLPKG